jgi:hypothetical protein
MSWNSSTAIRNCLTIVPRKRLSESPIDALTDSLTVTLTYTLAVSAIRKGISAPGKGRISYVSASHVRTPKGATNSVWLVFSCSRIPMNGTRIVISRSLGRHHAEASFGLRPTEPSACWRPFHPSDYRPRMTAPTQSELVAPLAMTDSSADSFPIPFRGTKWAAPP